MRTWRGGAGLLAGLALLAQPLVAQPLTLGEAVDLGLSRSPEVGQAQARIRAAEGGEAEARGAMLPQIEVTGAYGARHLENDARVRLGLSAERTKPLYATVSANQPLLDFGRRWFALRAQQKRKDAAKWDAEATGEYAAYQIARAYLQARAQQIIVESAEDNLTFLKGLGADIDEAVAKGVLTIAEKQQASERLQGAVLALDQSRGDLATARAELALLLGTNDFDLKMPPDPERIMPVTLAEALAVTETNDPRLLSADARFRSARSATSRATAEYAPQVGLQGSIRYGRDFEGYRGITRDYELLMVARWTLFDGGITSARVRQARAGEEEARFAYGQAERDSELAIQKSWIAIEGWRERLATQQERLKTARDLRVSYVEQFGIGRRSLLDLLDSQNAVYSASTDAVVAQHGLWLAEYGLFAQMGRLRSFLGADTPVLNPKMYGPR